MFWSWEIKFIHNYPKCTKNKVNKSKSFLFTQSVGKTWNNIERIVFVKRVSDGPPFIFIAVRPDADHSDGTGAEQIKTGAVSGQKTSKKSQNRAAHFLYINAGRKKRVNVVNDVCAISLPHLISRGEAELWWQLMTAYDMLWQLQFSPFPASLCPRTLDIRNDQASRMRRSQRINRRLSLVTDEERTFDIRDDRTVPIYGRYGTSVLDRTLDIT